MNARALRVWRGLVFAAVATLFQPVCAEMVGPPVAAAASLRHALPIIAENFHRAGHPMPRLSFGSSGNLSRQIRQGAPYELFLSADEAYVLALAKDGFTVGTGSPYALGGLALLVGRNGRLRPDPSLGDLRAALGDGRLRRFAIANPEHAPYGRIARDVLIAASMWPAIEKRLVVGENAAQAAQFVIAGGADGALVPRSLLISIELAQGQRFVALSPDVDRVLVHRMALLPSASETARALYAFLLTPPAVAVFERFGLAARPGAAR